MTLRYVVFPVLCLLPALPALPTTGHANERPVATTNMEQVQKGRSIYQQYCASCHGAEAEGVPDWEHHNDQGELPPPPHGPQGHTWKHSDALLYKMVEQGWRDPWNKTRRLTMPAFGSALTPTDIRAVITYLKTLWTPEQQHFQTQESKDAPFPPRDQ